MLDKKKNGAVKEKEGGAVAFTDAELPQFIGKKGDVAGDAGK